jgi:hypothetical protein
MKVEFKDTFFESVQKLVWYDTKLWKFWQTIRYDIPGFVKNIYRFRKELYSHAWWDYRYTLEMLHRSLVIMEAKMHDGMEIRESRDKKIAKMQRAIQILKNIIDDNYIEMAEAELGKLVMHDWEFEDVTDRPGYSKLVDNETASEKRHNRKVFNRARKLEAMEWKELWKIFEGQDIRGYKKLTKYKSAEEMISSDVWNEWFDGSDMRGWWD